jgi:hypothetical protein
MCKFGLSYMHSTLICLFDLDLKTTLYFGHVDLSLIWQNTERERERERVRVPTSDPATFATYHISKKRWVRSEPRISPPNGAVGRDVWEGLDFPRPRSADQVVYDNVNKVFYM